MSGSMPGTHTAMFFYLTPNHILPLQGVGGTLIGEDGLVVMAGAEAVEWYQILQTHGSMPQCNCRPYFSLPQSVLAV